MLLNRERASAVMDDLGLVGLIASCGENVTYASGYANWPMFTYKDHDVYALVPRDGSMALVVPMDAAEYLAEEPIDASLVYFYGSFFINRSATAVLTGAEYRLAQIRDDARLFPSSLEALGAALLDVQMRGGVVGLDERGMAPARWRQIVSGIADTRFVEAMDAFRRIRMVKTADEIIHLRDAVRGVEEGDL